MLQVHSGLTRWVYSWHSWLRKGDANRMRRISKVHHIWRKYLLSILLAGLLLILFGCTTSIKREPPLTDVIEPSLISHHTIEIRISASSDDAEESASGGVSRGDVALELVRNSTDQTVGLRFVGVNIPKEATITNAYIQFKTRASTSEATSLIIQGQASDNAATFSGTSFNISSRVRTGTAVAWSPASWMSGAASLVQQTPDLTPIIQEIIDRPGWSSGNALSLIITGTGRRIAWSFDGDQAGAPLLHVEYSVVETPPSINSFAFSPNVVEINQEVTFSWSVSDPEDDPLSCTLDVDGDGTPEYTIGDCRTTTSQTHTYTARGAYGAALTVNDIEGAAATANVVVEVIDPSLVTVEVRISASSDDAEESASGGVSRGDVALELVRNSTDQTVGLRFVGVNIPKEATITNAYIQFKTRASTSEATSLIIQGQASDSAATFSGAHYNISARARTGAAAAWAPAPWTSGASGAVQQTPDLTSVIQEIIDRPGWSSGNALAFIITGTGRRIAWSFDGDQAGAPMLHVEYSTVEAPPSVDSFTVSPGSVVAGQEVTFSWLVSDPKRDPLSCTLDVDGDGTPEYTISDCRSTTSQTHTYSTAARYWATLTATDPAHASDVSTLSVHITDSTSVTVAAAADIACDPGDKYFNGGAGISDKCRMKNTSDLVLSLQPTAVLTPGDHQYQDAVFDKFLQSYHPTWGRFRDITYPALGTHEYHNGNVAGYFEYFGAAAGDPTKGYYSFDLGKWHIVVLNSGCPHIGGCGNGSVQERWLRADLAANAHMCTLGVIHYPRFSSGTKGNHISVTAFWQALYEAGAEIVLSANDHIYERFAPQDPDGNLDPERGIQQFLVGTGGKSLHAFGTIKPNSEVRQNEAFGVLKLTLHPTSYEWAFISETGQILDSGSDTCR